MTKSVTIREVANAAGVSVCCVSWVLRNHPRSREIGEKTRERVLRIAEEMGYRRNLLASATRSGRVDTIAVLWSFKPELENAPINRIMRGIMQETSVRKFSIKIFPDDDLENTFRLIAENRIDKVISTSVEYDIREKTAALAEKYELDLVFCYERGHRGFPAVNTDNIEMMRRAVRYLVELGHSRIALLCVSHWARYVEERHEGYLLGMKDHGLTVDPRWIRCSDDIERSVRSMLALPENERPTAFLALDDSCAARAQRTAWECGSRIPEDFSVIGIGDTEVARAVNVPLTTFRECYLESGRMLVRLVLGDKIETAPDEFNVYRTYADLIEGRSVAIKR